MQTRSSSRLVNDQSSNPTSSTNPNPKGRNRKRSKQRIVNYNLEEHSPPVVTMADQRTMAQLLQAPTEGYEDAIVVPTITADNFELKHGLLTLVQNKQFFGHNKEDPHAHIRYLNKITSTLKFPNVPNTSIKLMLFPFSLEDQDSLNSAAGVSTNASTSGVSPDVAELKDMVKALLLDKKGQNRSLAPVKAVEESCVTCGGPVYQPSVFQQPAYQALAYQAPAPQTQGVSKEDFSAYFKANDAVMKNMQTQENKPEATKDTVNPTNNENTKDVQPQAVQSKSSVSISEPAIAPVSASNPNPKASIPYPSRRNDERNRKKANNQIEKFYQIFKDTSFEISFVGALILMPKFASTLKALIGNKKKLSEMARTLLNEHCFTFLLKKLPEKLGDLGKFLIPCDFPSMAECLALADLGASINLMPFSVWKRLSLPDLTPTCMTLDLADRSISRPVGVAKEVCVKVGSFHFPADFVVVDYDADPRVLLILGRSFLKTRIALIDVFEGELTLRVDKKAITFNLDQTLRYSPNYSDMTAKRINVIDMACEEYSQEVLSFLDTISSGNPTSYYDPIVSATSTTLTLFRNSDFLLEEVDAFLAVEDEPTSSQFHQYYLDPEEDILLLEAFLNDDPSLPLRIKEIICLKFARNLKSLPVIIAKKLSVEEKIAFITVLKSHKRAIAWKLSDINGINLEFCTHKIIMEEDFTPAVQHQRRVNPKIHDVIKQEVIKLIEAGLIYPISDSPWVSLVHCVPKKGGFTVVENEDNELILTRLVTGSGENHIHCSYGTFAYRRMPFGLCNAPATFQRCMMAIFHDMIEKNMEVFMDDFSVFGNSFQSCLSHLEKMLKRCEDTNLCLNWEKSHFMVKEGIVLGHKISKQGIDVDKVKLDVITKLPHPTTVKGIRSFLGHAGFYRRFIKDFSKIARPMTRLLEKDTSFIFSQECVDAFQTLKRKLTEALILIAPDWDMPFELMCDASDFAIREVLGQHQDKKFRPIYYASKTMTEAE
nr:reverse transcriptase domain-containing protein [Tanacetum cinerariifolium]